MLVNRKLTNQEVEHNNSQLKQLTLSYIINSSNLMDIYYSLNLYISVDSNGWSIENSSISIDDTFLKSHYTNIDNLKYKAYAYTCRKLNLKYNIWEYGQKTKNQFNRLYLKYFNLLVMRYQKNMGIQNDEMYFLTNDYKYVS